MPSRTMKASPHKVDIQVNSSSEASKAPKFWCLQQQELTFHLWESTRGNSSSLYVLGASWTALSNNSKEGFSCLVLGFLLGHCWHSQGSFSAQMVNFHLIYICIFRHIIACIVDSFRQLIVWFFWRFQTSLLVYRPLSLCIYLPPFLPKEHSLRGYQHHWAINSKAPLA